MKKLGFLLLLLVFTFSTLQAQKSVYVRYGLEEGLPQSQVRAICQDSTGFLWIGTMAGLSRFDGLEFENLGTDGSPAASQINCFYQGSTLFAGTTGAIYQLEGRKVTTLTLPDEYTGTRIIDIAENEKGELFLATAGNGLFKFSSGRFLKLSSEGLPDEYIRSLAFDQSDRLWVGTRKGLVLMDSEENFSPSPNLALNMLSISQIRMSSKGEMVISTFGNGVVFISENDTVNITSEEGLISDFIRCFEELAPGEFWFGSKMGLSSIKNEVVQAYDESNGLPYANIKSLGTDGEGNLWIGTDGQGILRRTGELFQSYSTSDGLVSELVMSFTGKDDDSFYIGTYDAGIAILKNGIAEAYSFNSELPSSTIWCMFQTSELFLAGTSSGLYIEERGKTRVMDESNGLPGHRITSVNYDKEYGFLIGTENGLAILDQKLKPDQVISEIDSKSLGGVRAIVIADRSIFLGTDIGVVKIQGESREIISGPIPEKASTYCLARDSYENLWIGTSSGLYVLDGGMNSLIEVSLANSFGSKNINFLTEYSDERLLVGTNDGVFSLDLKSFNDHAEPKTIHFTINEGLVSSETNQNAIFKSNNEIWFGDNSRVSKI